MAPTTAPLPDFFLEAPASLSVGSGEQARAGQPPERHSPRPDPPLPARAGSLGIKPCTGRPRVRFARPRFRQLRAPTGCTPVDRPHKWTLRRSSVSPAEAGRSILLVRPGWAGRPAHDGTPSVSHRHGPPPRRRSPAVGGEADLAAVAKPQKEATLTPEKIRGWYP